ncbi:hypothetical protein BC835DRAFT_1417952 [Cytidiella melzeri]|nr:hypothetical protein BC835DRAFT_1417952 [Cytidiella melzeri]
MDGTTSIAVGKTASAQCLPSEILDLIFAKLAQDARLLSSCSLVCKFWSDGARRYLFRTIVLKLRNSVSLREILGFLQGFGDSHWIRNVIFRSPRGDGPLRPPFLIACLNMLPELQSLVLDGVVLDVADNVQRDPHPKFRLGTLDLRMVRFTSPHSIGNIICVFDAIDTITARGLYPYTGVFYDERKLLLAVATRGPCSSDLPKPTVHNFKAERHFHFKDMPWLSKALVMWTSQGSLTSLDLACIGLLKPDIRSLCAWLSTAWFQITSLRLKLLWLKGLWKSRDPTINLNLQQLGLTALKSLTIFVAADMAYDVKDVWANLLDIIRSTPPGLTHLGVGFDATGRSRDLEYKDFNWKDFECAISGLGELQVLSFSRQQADFSDEQTQVIREQINQLNINPAVSLRFPRNPDSLSS